MINYTEQYRRQQKRYVFNSLPPHLFYFFHSGEEISLDLNYQQLGDYINSHFLQPNVLKLKSMTAKKLETEINKLHESLIPNIKPGYRTFVINIKKTDAPLDAEKCNNIIREKWRSANRESDLKIFFDYQDETKLVMQRIILRVASNNSAPFKKKVTEYILKNLSIDFIKQLVPNLTGELIQVVESNSETLKLLVNQLTKIDLDLVAEGKSIIKTDTKFCQECNALNQVEVFTQSLLNLPDNNRKIVIEAMSEFLFYPVLPNEIEAEMKRFCLSLLTKLQDDPIETAAWLCLEYPRIYPKESGSGKISRMLASIILMQEGIMPCIFENSEEYIAKVRQSNDNSKIFSDYFFSKVLQFAQLYKENPQKYHQSYRALTKEDCIYLEMYFANYKLVSSLELYKNPNKGKRSFTQEKVFSEPQSDLQSASKFAAIFSGRAKEKCNAKDYEAAFNLYELALKSYQQMPICNPQTISITYYNLSTMLHKLDRIQEALIYSTKAVELVDEASIQAKSIIAYHEHLKELNAAQKPQETLTPKP